MLIKHPTGEAITPLTNWAARLKTLILPAFALSWACEEPIVVETPQPVLTDGTVVYGNATLASLPYLTSRLIWRTGTDSTAASITFQQIVGIAASESRSIYVLDIGAGIRVFSWEGVYVSSFAPIGPGPAELANPKSLTVGGDTVFVLDNQLKFFDTAGEHVGQDTSNVGEYSRASSVTYTDSGLAIQRRWFAPRGGRDRSPTHPHHDSLLIRVKRCGQEESEGYPTQSYPMVTHDMSLGMGPPLLMGEVRVTVASDGRMFVPDQEHFRIDVKTLQGGVSERIVGEVPRVPASDTDFADLLQFMRIVRNSDDATHRRYVRAAQEDLRAKYRPVLGALLVSKRGHVLVERFDLGATPYNPYDQRSTKVWLIITPDLVPLGYTQLPGQFRPRVFTGCTIIGFETDEVNAHLLARYDVAPPSATALGC